MRCHLDSSFSTSQTSPWASWTAYAATAPEISLQAVSWEGRDNHLPTGWWETTPAWGEGDTEFHEGELWIGSQNLHCERHVQSRATGGGRKDQWGTGQYQADSKKGPEQALLLLKFLDKPCVHWGWEDICRILCNFSPPERCKLVSGCLTARREMGNGMLLLICMSHRLVNASYPA